MSPGELDGVRWLTWILLVPKECDGRRGAGEEQRDSQREGTLSRGC